MLIFYFLQSYIEKKALIHKELISAICNSSQDLIVYKDYNGKYLYCNQVYLDTVNKSLEEIKGKTEADLFSEKDAAKLNKISRKVLKGKVIRKKIEIETSNKIYDITATPLLLTKGVFGVLIIAKDVTHEEILKNELEDQEQMFRSVLQGMPIATYLKDLNGNVTYENKMAIDFLGLSDSDNANKWNYEEKRADEISNEDNEIISEGKCISREKQITLKNNDKRWFKVTKCPIINHKKKIIGICSVARDIDAEKTAAEQRETYVATLTHDLKTPTIAQIKALDLLLNDHMGPLNNEQKELLSLTKDSCNFMYEMLSTLLSTYKYENGDYTLNCEKCNIISLAEESIKELEAMLKEKNVTIHMHTEGSQFNTECDRMQIKRVLINILGNAISYAYNNTNIAVTIKQDENGIGFEAKNESAYINPETMNNLFKKYVSHAAKFNKVGVGLGLYLSKQIINAHNGNIYAKSFEDNHNIFGFVLPLVNKIEDNSVVA
ncbi:MAG: PAS domain-containing protein [Candidatus Gastranaerophilaceae bacterium]|nr:PAS domain-containing protein [Candidatus Gastranaerophilaceae bacterium]